MANYGQIICPKEKFHPNYSYGNEISISISSPEKDWYLKYVKLWIGVFLVFHLDKDSQSLYGYLSEKEKEYDDKGSKLQQIPYNLKIKDNMLDNNLYTIIFITKNCVYIKLIWIKQDLICKNIQISKQKI